MSWLDDIVNPELPTGQRALQAAACVVGAPFCIAGEVAERAGAAAERAREDFNRQLDATRESLPGLIDQSTAGFERVADAATEPLTQVNRTMMWIAIGVAIVAGLIVLGVLLYFTWPFLVGLRGGVRP